MTYGMILSTIGISIFFASIVVVFCIWRIRVRERKIIEQARILEEMVKYSRDYLLYIQKDDLNEFPCIRDSLENTYEAINGIIKKGDYNYRGVRISSCKREDWLNSFIKEHRKANDDIKKLLSMNARIIDRVYKNKNPISYIFSIFKKKRVVANFILYCYYHCFVG